MKLPRRLSERQKQDDKTACHSMSKALRAGTVWESTEMCLFSASKSVFYTSPFVSSSPRSRPFSPDDVAYSLARLCCGEWETEREEAASSAAKR